MTITHEPVYFQLTKVLKEYAEKENLSSGDKFLSEREVSNRFNVSRTTANKAISALVAEGVLEGRRGVGTFYIGRKITIELASLVSFTEKANKRNSATRSIVKEFRNADKSDMELFPDAGLPFLKRGRYINRVRLLDDKPVIHEQRLINPSLLPDIRSEDLEHSFYEYIATMNFSKDVICDQVLTAITLDVSSAKLLGLPLNAPALLIKSTAKVNNNTILWYEHTIYNAELFEIRATGNTREFKGLNNT